MNMLNKIAFLSSGCILLSGYSFYLGYHSAKKNIAEEALAHVAKIEETKAQSNAATTEIVTQYVDRIVKIEGKTKEIVKNVPVYIENNHCALPNNFIKLHNAAAQNRNIEDEPAGNADDPTQTIDFITATEVIVENYGIYHQTAEQLLTLQSWIKEQNRVIEHGNDEID